MREVVFDFDEFKSKVDLNRSIHHYAYSKCIDKQHGVFYRVEFWLTGVGRNGGHIVCFYAERRTTIAEREQDKKWYDIMVEKYAKPLGSTEGEWRP